MFETLFWSLHIISPMLLSNQFLNQVAITADLFITAGKILTNALIK